MFVVVAGETRCRDAVIYGERFIQERRSAGERDCIRWTFEDARKGRVLERCRRCGSRPRFCVTVGIGMEDEVGRCLVQEFGSLLAEILDRIKGIF
jgi:hypothetical protein